MTKTSALYATMTTDLLRLAEAAAHEGIGHYTAEWVKLGRKVDADDILYAASVGCPVATRLLKQTAELNAVHAELFTRD